MQECKINQIIEMLYTCKDTDLIDLIWTLLLECSQ